MLTTKKTSALPACSIPIVVAAIFLLQGCTPPGPRSLLDGERLLEAGRFEEAAGKLELASELLPEQPQAWNHLGLAYHYLGRARDAEAAYLKALELDADLDSARFNLGCLLHQIDRTDEAIRELTSFVLLRPTSVDGWVRLGNAQIRDRQWDEVARTMTKAYSLNPKDPEVLNGLGMVSVHRKNLKEARRFFQAALREREGYAPALLNLAVMAQTYENDPDQALQLYREYLVLQPRPANWADVEQVTEDLFERLNPRPAVEVAARTARQTAVSQTPPETASPEPASPRLAMRGMTNRVQAADSAGLAESEPGIEPIRTGPIRTEAPTLEPAADTADTEAAPVQPKIASREPSEPAAPVEPEPTMAAVDSSASKKPAPKSESEQSPERAREPVRTEPEPALTLAAKDADGGTAVKEPSPPPPPKMPAAEPVEASRPPEPAPPAKPAAEPPVFNIPPRPAPSLERAMPPSAVEPEERATRPEPTPSPSLTRLEPEPAARQPDPPETSEEYRRRMAALSSPAPSRVEEPEAEKRPGFFRRLNPVRLFRRDNEPEKERPTPLPGDVTALPQRSEQREPPPEPSPRPAQPPVPSEPEPAPPDPVAVETPTPTVSYPRYTYQNPVRSAPGDRAKAQSAFQEGLQAHKQNRFREAMQAYRNAVAADASFFDAHYNLGLAAYQAGSTSESLTAYEKALALRSTSLSARFNFAKALEKSNYPLDAVAELRRVLEASPDLEQAHLALANLYANTLKNPEQAAEHYRKVLELNPRHPQAQTIRYWLASRR